MPDVATPAVVLDSGAVTALAGGGSRAANALVALRRLGSAVPRVPTIVLVESTTGDGSRDAQVHRLLRGCVVEEAVPRRTALRAAELRRLAGRGSAVDALVVAAAEPDAVVLTGDPADIVALASHADRVRVAAI